MNSELNNALTAAGQKAQYDASAKRLLGQKSILSHILVKTVEEFKGMDPKEAEKFIEGAPLYQCSADRTRIDEQGKRESDGRLG